MTIAIIGAGNIGGNIARRLVPAGYELILSFTRDYGKLSRLADEIGARAAPPGEAAAKAQVVVLSVPWSVIPIVLELVGPLAVKGGGTDLALDTAEPAGHLRRYYESAGIDAWTLCSGRVNIPECDHEQATPLRAS